MVAEAAGAVRTAATGTRETTHCANGGKGAFPPITAHDRGRRAKRHGGSRARREGGEGTAAGAVAPRPGQVRRFSVLI